MVKKCARYSLQVLQIIHFYQPHLLATSTLTAHVQITCSCKLVYSGFHKTCAIFEGHLMNCAYSLTIQMCRVLHVHTSFDNLKKLLVKTAARCSVLCDWHRACQRMIAWNSSYSLCLWHQLDTECTQVMCSISSNVILSPDPTPSRGKGSGTFRAISCFC